MCLMSDLLSSSAAPLWVKIPHVPGLYRNTSTGVYYGVKKIKNRRKEKSLFTADRKIAERRLKEWMASLGKVDVEVEKTTIRQLFDRTIALSRGKSESTQTIVESVLEEFMSWWPHGSDFQVRNIRPSHLEEWLVLKEKELRNTSYNRYAGVIKQAFALAVNDRILAESPFGRVRTRWKKPEKPQRRVPTEDQFQAIIASVRSQKCSKYAADTADFLEFLGLAGVGQAEASSLTWGDVDFDRELITFRRHKTGALFTVPIYSHLKPLLERLKKQAGEDASRTQRVLKINDGKKALTNACARLGLPHFSQRNLRQSLIMRLWKAGIDKKLIAKWQGHQDGGQLILDTYTEVFGDDDAMYERQQLNKLLGGKTAAKAA